MSEEKTLVEVKNLKQYFDINMGMFKTKPLKAVDDISFTIKKGETLGLVGESGCGKTTAGRSILHLYKPTAGEVIFDGKKVDKSTMQEYRTKATMVFQDPYSSLNPRMTVADIIAEPLDIHKLYTTKEERQERVLELMNYVGLNSEHASRYAHEFSGGQRQRIGIARALAVNPEFIVCDEPVSALDVSIQAQVINMFDELQEKFGLTYLFIAHDLLVVRHISDRIAVMNQGVIQQIGTPKALYQRPANSFVATFIGRTNLMKAKIWVKDGKKGLSFPSGYRLEMKNLTSVQDGQDVLVSVRPEELVIERVGDNKDNQFLPGKVEYSTFLGLNTHYIVEIDGGFRAEIIQESMIDDIIENGTKIELSLKAEKINVFSEDGEVSLVK